MPGVYERFVPDLPDPTRQARVHRPASCRCTAYGPISFSSRLVAVSFLTFTFMTGECVYSFCCYWSGCLAGIAPKRPSWCPSFLDASWWVGEARAV